MMAAMRHVAGLPGMSPEPLRSWQGRYEVDAGAMPGQTTVAAARTKRLQEENAERTNRTRFSRLRACFLKEPTAPDRQFGSLMSTGIVSGRTRLPPKQSINSTRPNSSATADPGGPSSKSNSRHSSGCSGGTTSAPMANSMCAPRSRSRTRPTPTRNQPGRPRHDRGLPIGTKAGLIST